MWGGWTSSRAQAVIARHKWCSGIQRPRGQVESSRHRHRHGCMAATLRGNTSFPSLKCPRFLRQTPTKHNHPFYCCFSKFELTKASELWAGVGQVSTSKWDSSIHHSPLRQAHAKTSQTLSTQDTLCEAANTIWSCSCSWTRTWTWQIAVSQFPGTAICSLDCLCGSRNSLIVLQCILAMWNCWYNLVNDSCHFGAVECYRV